MTPEPIEGTLVEAKQQNPWYKQWWAIALGVLIVLSPIGAFVGDSEDEETAEAQETKEGAGVPEEDDASESDGEPTEEGPAAMDYEVRLDEDWDEVWIEFELQDHFTSGLMAIRAQRTAREALAEAYEEYPDAGRYVVGIPSQDDESSSWISNAAFQPETLASLDLDDRTLNVFEHLDAGSAHPELLD